MLEMDAARSLNKNHVARAEILREPLAGGLGITKKNCWDSAGTSGCSKMFGVALNGNDEIEAGLSGGAATCDVKRGAVLAHFEHLAGY
jgi:hypothetical protein